VQVWAAERILRVDARDHLRQRLLDVVMGGDVGRAEPRRPRADIERVGGLAGDLARLRHVGRHQGQTQLGDEVEVRDVAVADHLSAQLDRATVVQHHLLDPAANPVPSLEHRDRGATRLQVTGGAESGEPCAYDDDVGAGHAGLI
jgi:hypothetical protein